MVFFANFVDLPVCTLIAGFVADWSKSVGVGVGVGVGVSVKVNEVWRVTVLLL